MKIKPEHYQVIADAITNVQLESPILTLQSYLNAGNNAKRWRWDLLWEAQRKGLLSRDWVMNVVYRYANDEHIDTALRRITNTK